MDKVWNSRRSPVFSVHGVVSSSQHLASKIGAQILERGGNAADAAVAVAAALNVLEPCSTGIGGDCFCIYYDVEKKQVSGLNGTGRCPEELSLDWLKSSGHVKPGQTKLESSSPHSITVPGAAAGWIDTVDHFGSGNLSLEDILAPAINLATTGFPVSTVAARSWANGAKKLQRGPHAAEMLIKDPTAEGGLRGPMEGEIMTNVCLANTFRELAKTGRKAFYTREGRIAQEIISIVQNQGGKLTMQDLENHQTTMDEPISVVYGGIRVFEMPPNGQGITALVALNILNQLRADLEHAEHNSAEYLHIIIESLRLAFADTRYYVADPSVVHVPTEELLSEEYAKQRAKLVDVAGRARADIKKGSPTMSSSTVYFSVVDAVGNSCSFINSNYEGFGTDNYILNGKSFSKGLIPKGCGFTLQNRGSNFSLEEEHPNVLAPGKRPYHTIIPGMALRDDTGDLFACFGVMGGFNQPQGHVQVLLNMIEHGMNPQEALDAPRICIMDGTANGRVGLEEGIAEETKEALQKKGHKVKTVSGWERSLFGRGQIIWKHPSTGVYWAGADPRADSSAVAALPI